MQSDHDMDNVIYTPNVTTPTVKDNINTSYRIQKEGGANEVNNPKPYYDLIHEQPKANIKPLDAVKKRLASI
jgi:P pilus assembly chaperone PapD